MTRLRFGISEKNQHEYWEMLNAGLLEAATRLGVAIEIQAPAFEDVGQQIEHIQHFIDTDVDGIAFVATKPAAFRPVVEKALRKGIPVMCMDLDAPTSGRYLYVGTLEPTALGRTAGEHMVRLLPGGGKVAVQTGSTEAAGAVGKMNGFREVVERAGIEIVDVLEDGEDVEAAIRNAKRLIKDHPNLAGLYGVYGYHPWCQARVVQAVGVSPRPKIVGWDMVPETVTCLQEGLIDASLWIGEYYFGYYTAAYLTNMAKLGVSETLSMSGLDNTHLEGNAVRLPVVTYTRENVSQFIDWSHRHGAQRRISKPSVPWERLVAE